MEIEENICECEDRPITFCPKCKTFYYKQKNGDRVEIAIQVKKASY